MIRQLLVLLILIIGQCIIAMELPKVVEASENPLHGIDTSARISELHSAPDPPSSNQLSTSSASLQTLDDLQKDNPPRLDNQKEEHRISIPDDSSSTTAQCESSQHADLAMFEFNTGKAQYISLPNHESSSTQLQMLRPGNVVEAWKRTDPEVQGFILGLLAMIIVGLAVGLL
ncbi:hypothetical protein KEM48_003433 [Puccinia striiformis f. sp. tritici PST-130]|uniref:Uncharacterized protein n=2 Tax=Puccinia striiformis TaxID=27350 RepID=A0A2S4UVF2_9BASI|nr:hypothetical protein KEM48_003433 [Puccinia striiformis f. sp. tritici PST-130]POW01269.1 hypothetical protein PSTT_12610 [Puccinia striiformis]